MTSDLFGGPTVNDVRLDDQIACVEREIAMRERAYPRWVERGRMGQSEADRELLFMRAVLHTLQRVQRPDPLGDALNSNDGSYRP